MGHGTFTPLQSEVAKAELAGARVENQSIKENADRMSALPANESRGGELGQQPWD